MSKIARSRIVDPADLNPAQLRAFVDELFDVQCEVFDGVSRDELRRYVVESPARTTEIEVYEDADGRMMGYCAAHFFDREFNAEPCVIMRMEAGVRRACRGTSLANTFVTKKVVAFLASNPRGRLYYLGSLVHPSSYSAFCRGAAKMWPHADWPTPPDILAFMCQLGDEFGLEVVDARRPLVRRVGWITRDTEVEQDYWRTCRRPAARFFIQENPDYTDGHGLLTLIPLDLSTVGRSLSRIGKARIRKLAEPLVGRAEPSEDDLVQMLAGARELDGVPLPALRQMIQRGERKSYRAQETVFHQGDPGTAFYIVLSGSAFIYLGHEDPVLVDQVPDADVFGGMALLTGEPRSASVLAATKLTLLAVHRDVLLSVLEAWPAASAALWRNVIRDRFDNFVQTLERFEGSTRAERLAWFGEGRPVSSTRELADGEVVFLAVGQLQLAVEGGWGTVTAPALLATGRKTLELDAGARAWCLPKR